MRLFVGIAFSPALKARLRAGTAKLKPLVAKGRFSDWEGYHLTLCFLGEVDEALLPRLTDALQQWEPQTEPFEIALGSIGCFPKRGGDVLWVGFQESEPLVRLQKQMEELLEPLGFKGEARPYRPHLTLARNVRLAEPLAVLEDVWPLKAAAETVDAVVLFHSTRVDDRLTYVPLCRRPLKG